jgi:hypothetical protein
VRVLHNPILIGTIRENCLQLAFHTCTYGGTLSALPILKMQSQRIFAMNYTWTYPKSLIGFLLLLSMALLAACGTAPDMSTEVTASTPTPSTAQVEATSTPVVLAVTTSSTSTTLFPGVQNELAPVLIGIPGIDLSIDVGPMGWRIAEVDGERTTVWLLPDEGVGWHPNSAVLGANGNVVISGHQLFGDASFAALALGDVEIGQEVLLTSVNGDLFTYRVVEVSEPLPISRNFAQEQALAERYLAQTNEPTLTLIAGWPDYSSTHRIIVTAKLVDAKDE